MKTKRYPKSVRNFLVSLYAEKKTPQQISAMVRLDPDPILNLKKVRKFKDNHGAEIKIATPITATITQRVAKKHANQQLSADFKPTKKTYQRFTANEEVIMKQGYINGDNNYVIAAKLKNRTPQQISSHRSNYNKKHNTAYRSPYVNQSAKIMDITAPMISAPLPEVAAYEVMMNEMATIPVTKKTVFYFKKQEEYKYTDLKTMLQSVENDPADKETAYILFE